MTPDKNQELTSTLLDQFEYPEYYYETWINGNKTHVARYMLALEQKQITRLYFQIMEQFMGSPEQKKLTNLIDQLRRKKYGIN